MLLGIAPLVALCAVIAAAERACEFASVPALLLPQQLTLSATATYTLDSGCSLSQSVPGSLIKVTGTVTRPLLVNMCNDASPSGLGVMLVGGCDAVSASAGNVTACSVLDADTCFHGNPMFVLPVPKAANATTMLFVFSHSFSPFTYQVSIEDSPLVMNTCELFSAAWIVGVVLLGLLIVVITVLVIMKMLKVFPLLLLGLLLLYLPAETVIVHTPNISFYVRGVVLSGMSASWPLVVSVLLLSSFGKFPQLGAAVRFVSFLLVVGVICLAGSIVWLIFGPLLEWAQQTVGLAVLTSCWVLFLCCAAILNGQHGKDKDKDKDKEKTSKKYYHVKLASLGLIMLVITPMIGLAFESIVDVELMLSIPLCNLQGIVLVVIIALSIATVVQTDDRRRCDCAGEEEGTQEQSKLLHSKQPSKIN
eukprot:TRINITY_DN1395_c0_g1_i5.p1 TRINITY_DN1395_c0_g1~~TRINITY_DN1395_c0_g1_i5.p1  ORF type:complete len:420 (+),score=63.89 TRINITY_DN1395_c0_g1_i5:96-1355(+)